MFIANLIHKEVLPRPINQVPPLPYDLGKIDNPFEYAYYYDDPEKRPIRTRDSQWWGVSLRGMQ